MPACRLTKCAQHDSGHLGSDIARDGSRGDPFSIGTTGKSAGHPATFDGTDGSNSAELSTNSLPIRAGDPGTWIVTNSNFPGYAIRHTAPKARLQFSVVDEHGRSVTTL